ncbi:hypothetical protein HK405_002030 [Cladochytrium tenue]|nr:hypothetical protein HK405_002030 [Cladochytrium tenue]
MENSELWHLDEFKFRLEQATSGGITSLKGCFDEEYEQMKSRKEGLAARSGTPVGSGSATPTLKKAKLPWTAKEVTTLVKAVKSLPGGTAGRWEKIAAYVNLHGGEDGGPAPDRGPEECIKKSRELQDASVTERNAMQAAAAAAAKKKDVEIKEVPSSRADTDGRTPGTSTASNPSSTAQRDAASPEPPGSFVVPSGDLSWSPAQQAALEAGLRKYPASQFAANPATRWDKIAAEIEGKSKKEVKQRVKELAEAVKTKNKAKK